MIKYTNTYTDTSFDIAKCRESAESGYASAQYQLGQCYENGIGVEQDMTMEQMIDHCAQFTDDINRNSGENLTVEQMKEQMRRFFPHLKRWKK